MSISDRLGVSNKAEEIEHFCDTSPKYKGGVYIGERSKKKQDDFSQIRIS